MKYRRIRTARTDEPFVRITKEQAQQLVSDFDKQAIMDFLATNELKVALNVYGIGQSISTPIILNPDMTWEFA